MIALLVLMTGLLSSFSLSAQLLWSDEFNSGNVPDSQVWSYDLGDNGWGNQELQEYTSDPENARIENGNLIIAARQKLVGSSPVGFTSARLKTENKLMFKYGTIEARIRVPNLQDGLWPAFWTLGNNISDVGWPACGELDILEMGWRDAVRDNVVNRWLSSAAHWEFQGTHALYGREYRSSLLESEDLNNDYIVISMNWTPDTIATYLDGREIWRMNINLSSCTDCEELHEPHFMILNLAVGGTFTGLLTNSEITATLPGEMMVDYVRIYDNGFTELTGTALSDQAPDIGPAHSGSWYYPDQSGHGFSMEFGETSDGSPLALVYWYTYDSLGNPMFMIGTGVPEHNRVTIQFQSPYGMMFGMFDPDSVIREDSGIGIFEFDDKNNASFDYTPTEFSVSHWGHSAIDSLPLSKLFGVPAPESFTPQ